MTGILLGIDIGTTATKGILLDPGQGIIAQAEAPSILRSPEPGWAEEDPRQWWENTAVVTRACLGQVRLTGADVAAVGVSGMVPTVIVLDGSGEPLYPSIQQNDARAVQEIADFISAVDPAAVLARTGSAITQQSVGPKLLWLRRHYSEQMARAAHVLGSYDYIVYRLTGELSAERNWALESGLFDLAREDWDPALLDLSEISAAQLGAVHWPAEVVGEITAEAAAFTGLAAGTPVVAGSADHIASAFSAGLNAPGETLVKLGGAGDILYCLDQPLVDERLYLDYHVVPGKYYINGCMAASGSIIRWFREQFAPDLDYGALDAEAAGVSPGSEGLIVLPYFLGEKTPVNDPQARGVFFGLTLSHTRGHMFRAVLEGIAYGFRHHLDVLAARGLAATKARVTNGGARSRLWKQVTADVLGLPLEQIRNHPGSSLGAAFIAGKGVGLFAEWGEIERFVEIDSVIEPDPQAFAGYGELFAVYLALYAQNRDLFRRLGG